MSPFKALSAVGLLLVLSGQSHAAGLATPRAEPILTVSGAIAKTNGGDVARFDAAMLEAIGTSTLRTKTPWYGHVVEFEGVPMKDLLAHVGATGSQVTATALNDYTVTIPISDFEAYGVILAMKRDGKAMPIRDKGPLFIVYPFSSHPDLDNDQYYSRSAWQVKALEVR